MGAGHCQLGHLGPCRGPPCTGAWGVVAGDPGAVNAASHSIHTGSSPGALPLG